MITDLHYFYTMGLFDRNREALPDFSAVGVDLHNHVLPGIDDGSPSLEESLSMLRAFADAGFRKIITTPHVISAVYPNTREKILGQLYHLQDAAAEAAIPLEIEASAEYHLDYEFPKLVESGEVIPFGGNRLLVELPFQKPAFDYFQVLFDLQVAGYEPVISHPERYSWLMGNGKLYARLKDRGFRFQLNLNSLTGFYGFPSRLSARQLVDAGMVDYVGSDAHFPGAIREMSKALGDKYFLKLVKGGLLRNAEL